MVKRRSFNQPDGISITLNERDMYETENYTMASLFCHKNLKYCFVFKCRKSDILLVLLLLCGDIETQPGPPSLSRAQFQEIISKRGLKIVHQNIRGLECNFDMLQDLIESCEGIDIFLFV